MSLVIAAGSTRSGWEALIPAVEPEAGGSAPDGLANWLDELSLEAASGAEGVVASQVVVSAEMSRRVHELLEVQEGRALWIADSRNSLMLDSWAEQFPEARFVLFCRRLESAVAQALADGAEVNGALSEWTAGSRRLLTFQRRNRGRSVLVDAGAARRSPDAYFAAVRELGIAVDETPAFRDASAEPLSLERLVAGYLVTDHADLLSLQAELDAAAVPLDGGARTVPIPTLDALDGYLAVKAAVGRLESELEKERETGRRAGEGYEASIQTLRSSESDLRERLAESERALETGAVLRQELEAESELLLLQVEQLQQELERIHGELSTRERALQASDQERLGLSGQLQKARAETEGVRLQLRASVVAQEEAAGIQKELERLQRELNSCERALLTSDQERLGLSEQVQKARAETEVLRFQLRASVVAQEEAVGRGQHLQAEATKLREEIEGLSARHREALEQIERSDREVVELKRRIVEIQQSVAWKAAAPLRVLSGKRSRHEAKARAASKHEIKLIERSGLFDREWYLSRYEDVKESGMDPIKHYLEFGAAEGRDPSSAFETRSYLAAYPDVAESGLNPLLHYIRFGREEGRQGAPETTQS